MGDAYSRHWRLPGAFGALLLVAQGAGCSDDPVPPPLAQMCPAGWVASERGGCGPAVLLCVPGGGAATGACRGVDLARSPTVVLPDGGVATGFRRLPDGGIGGGWHEPGEGGGPPYPNWSPDLSGAPVLEPGTGNGDGPPGARWRPEAGVPACPAGWARREDGVCDPALRTDCPEGSGPLPGGRCTATAARDCPEGPYAGLPAEAVGARVAHVRGGSPGTGADGSEGRPFPTIGAAVSAVGADGWVLVSGGEYVERVIVTSPVHLLGVCARRVTLRPPEGAGPLLVVREIGTRLDVRGVRLVGSGAYASEGGRILLRSIRIERVAGAAVEAHGAGAEVEMEEVSVASVDAGLLAAVEIEGGARATLRGVAVEDWSGAALASRTEASRVEAEVCAFRGGADLTRSPRWGMVAEGGTLSTRRVAISAARTAAIVAQGRTAQLLVEDEWVSSIGPGGVRGSGVRASEGAHASMARASIDGTGGTAVSADGEGTEVRVRSSLIRDAWADAVGNGGGVRASAGGRVELDGVLVRASTGAGCTVTTGGTLRASDAEFGGTRTAGEVAGYGVSVAAGSRATLERVLVEDTVDVGVRASGEGASVEVLDSAIRDVRPQPASGAANGVEVTAGASVTITETSILGAAAVGLLVSGGRATLERSSVAEIRPPTTPSLAAGVFVGARGPVTARGVLLADIRGNGVEATGGRVTCTLEQTRIRDVAWGGSLVPNGIGIKASTGAVIDAVGVTIGPLEGIAVVSQVGASVTLRASRVADVARREGLDVYSTAQGFVVSGRAALRLEDTVVADTASRAVYCTDAGTRCDFARVTFADTHGAAIGVYQQAVADVSDTWFHETHPAWTGEFGMALVSEGGSRVEARRVVVEGSHRAGVVSLVAPSVLTLVDSVVRDTEPQTLDGTFGVGLAALFGARLDATRVLVQRSAEAGVGAMMPGTAMRLEDVIVDGVRPTDRGFGIGVGISGGGRLEFERFAVVGVHGLALASAAAGDVAVIRGSEVSGRDAYVRSVLPTTIAYDPDRPGRAAGARVAYGLHAADGCRLRASRVALEDGAYGYFNSGGEIALDGAWISGQTIAVGGGSDPDALASVRIQQLSQRANANTVPVVAAGLPELRIPPPFPPCANPPCGR